MAFSAKIPLSRRQLWEQETGKSQFSIRDCKSEDEPDTICEIAAASAPVNKSLRYVKSSKDVITFQEQTCLGGDVPITAQSVDGTDLDQQIIDTPEKLNFSKLDVLFNCVSIILYITDIGLDCFVCYKHYLAIDTDPLYFAFTLVFILLGSVVTSIFSIWWYYLEYLLKKQQMLLDASSRTGFQLRIVACVFTLGPVVRYVDTIAYGLRSRQKGINSKLRKYYHSEMRFQRTDGAMLRLFEAFLESAPQFLLQVYIVFVRRGLEGEREGNYFLVAVTIASIVSSIISLAWSVVAYHKANRMSRHDVEEIKPMGLVVRFAWRIFEITPRIVIMAMFMSAFGYYLGIFAALHYLLMVAWLLKLNTTFCEKPGCEYGFIIVIGLVWCFCFFNLKDGHTRRTSLLFYLLFSAENIGLALGWHYKTLDEDIRYRPILLPIVLGSIVPMVISMVSYYKLLHRKPIDNCLPCSYWTSMGCVGYKNTDGSMTEKEALSTQNHDNTEPSTSPGSPDQAVELPLTKVPEEPVEPEVPGEPGDILSSIPAYRAPTPCRSLRESSSMAEGDAGLLPNLDDCVEVNGYLEPSVLSKPSAKLCRQDTIPKYMAPVPNNYGATIPGGPPTLHNLTVSVSTIDPSHGSTLPGSSNVVTVVSNDKHKDIVSSTPSHPPLASKPTLDKPPVPLPRLSIHHESPSKSVEPEPNTSSPSELTLTTVSDLPADASHLFGQTLSPSPDRAPAQRYDELPEASDLDITPVAPRSCMKEKDNISGISSLDTPMKVDGALGETLDLSIDTPCREVQRSKRANTPEMSSEKESSDKT